jgi:hypothetical protein
MKLRATPKVELNTPLPACDIAWEKSLDFDKFHGDRFDADTRNNRLRDPSALIQIPKKRQTWRATSTENFSLSKRVIISRVISIYFQTTAISRFRANRHRRETNCSRRTRRRFEVALERQIPQVSMDFEFLMRAESIAHSAHTRVSCRLETFWHSASSPVVLEVQL